LRATCRLTLHGGCRYTLRLGASRQRAGCRPGTCSTYPGLISWTSVSRTFHWVMNVSDAMSARVAPSFCPRPTRTLSVYAHSSNLSNEEFAGQHAVPAGGRRRGSATAAAATVPDPGPVPGPFPARGGTAQRTSGGADRSARSRIGPYVYQERLRCAPPRRCCPRRALAYGPARAQILLGTQRLPRRENRDDCRELPGRRARSSRRTRSTDRDRRTRRSLQHSGPARRGRLRAGTPRCGAPAHRGIRRDLRRR